MISNIDSNCSESDQEDYGSYFLQPTQSPYNITERVQQANNDLFSANFSNEKIQKVKFNENLVTYEPELTDDDVNSIESDNIDVIEDNIHCLDYKTITKPNINNFDIFNIEEIEEIEDITELEEIETEDNLIEDIEDIGELNNTEQLILENPKPKKKKPLKLKRKCPSVKNLKCENHCIDKIEYDLSMSVQKLNISSKPKFCPPPLKLQERKCCEHAPKQYHKLPMYSGYRSEYGRSLKQIKSDNKKIRALNNLKEIDRHNRELLRIKRTQQNEEIFQQWLNNVELRKNQKRLYLRKCYSHDSSGSPKDTTQICLCIQLPHSATKNRHIGNLIIEKSAWDNKKINVYASF